MAVTKKMPGSAGKKAVKSNSNSTENIGIHQTFPRDLYDRISRYTKDKYLGSEQAAVRLMCGNYLDRVGY